MHALFQRIVFALSLLTLLSACKQADDNRQTVSSGNGATKAVAATQTSPVGSNPSTDFVIGSQPCIKELLLDTDGKFHRSSRGLYPRVKELKTTYLRVGCNCDTCKQEITAYVAMQYPADSVVQYWMAEHVANYFYGVTRQADILIHGEHATYDEAGDKITTNTGCAPYEGVLDDEGKEMFLYYHSKLWTIGSSERRNHGPQRYYGCVIYRCWESQTMASYFVGYSNDNADCPVHLISTFDRRNGHHLDLTDIIREDCMADLNDLLVDAARERHAEVLQRNHQQLPDYSGESDYGTAIEIKELGLVEEGLAVSTGALPFDQWPGSTHILIIPYSKANLVLNDIYRR